MDFQQYLIIIIAVFMVGGIIRTILGPTIWDRMLGMNLISSKIIMAIVVFALILDKSYLLDIAIAYTLIGFIGMVLLARFIERRGDL
ncbi:MAG: multicomponent Na+:H+ antiporter subunit [Clostridiales bacterium]|uniref:Multiple resistance and pH regulation protein F n=1 Tax=Mahella australiensis (strain DSM 15567 / CIP 107919 / 50-1 BON) TaxID=697281 RepID=F4A1E8_MAHA5|nr:monovalent cation/H+ antiporter complex subunit F [Mahella australiensis]AEE97067.1 multiple resistance and pH regulation protein F [Mahella australiensis 50-1 BON]MDK2991712.1 multicomponent Na+:H+ antiporter subunit [Clostridiales bacterium]